MTPEEIIAALNERSLRVGHEDSILMMRAAIALRVATADRQQGAEHGHETREEK